MESGKNEQESSSTPNDDTIYKSLTHPLRRNSIKTFEGGKKLAFSEIKKQVDPIDSPALSYHLKSLQMLIQQQEGKYVLSEVGEAALNLLLKVDQGTQIKKYQRKFLYAYIITVFCWIAAETLVPIAYHAQLGDWSFSLIMIVLNCTGVINYMLIWMLHKRY
jgi:hypothetical protein